jgi:hypothetical protein
MNLDFTKPWEKYSKIKLDKRKREKAEKWIESRREGKDIVFDNASLSTFKSDEFDLSGLNPNKPTALLASNIIWDLSALNKQVFFATMMEWIIETIKWFKLHREFQLIIKTHPSEENPVIPETKEKVENVLMDNGITLSENIFFLRPKAKISVYQLFPIANVGLVYSTTVGIEMAALGIPVITAAKSTYRKFGFTIDPENKTDYFAFIEKALKGITLIDKMSQYDLSRKFILFYFYHYFTRINFMEYNWGSEPIIKIKSIRQLKPGNNKHLDYILDSIIGAQPILSEDRWPDEN